MLAGIGAVSLLAVGCLYDFRALAPRLQIETEVNSILPTEDEGRRVYDRFREHFGNDELVLVGLIDGDVLTPESLERIQKLTWRLEAVEGVRRVVSLSNTPDIWAEDGQVRVEPVREALLRNGGPPASLRERVLANPVLAGNLVSRDGQAAAFLVYPQEMSEKEFLDRGIDQEIERVSREEAGDATIVIAGSPAVKAVTSRLLLRDLLVFVPAGFLLMALVAFWTFGTKAGVLVPLSSILLAELWTLAVVAAAGRSLNLVTYIVPALVQAIGFAYTVHVVSEHGDVVRERGGRAGGEAVFEALRRVSPAVLMTGLTTAAGFLSLATSNLPAIREFGLFCVVGVASSALIALTYAPAMLSVLPARPSTERGETWFDRTAARVGAFDVRHRGPILLAGCAAVALAVFGLTRIEVSTSLVSNLKPDNPLRLSIQAFNEHFDGSAQTYVMLEAKEPGTFRSPEAVGQLRDLQDWLEEQPEVVGTSSMADYLMVVNKAFHDGDPAQFAIPATPGLIRQFLLFVWSDQLEHFIDKRLSTASILIRTPSLDTRGHAQLLDRIEARLGSFPAGFETEVTGNTALLVRTIDDIAIGQVISLSAATLIIFGILVVYFRSFRVGLIALIPNALPVLVYFGLLGLTGVTLNVITSLIACIILGIAVDDTIHILVRFKENAQIAGEEAKSAVEALRRVARPVTSTTAALTAGYLLLGASALKHQVEFGLLAGGMLAFAWLVDVTFTPALISRLRLQPKARPVRL